tara:strand:+ start:88 stop:279 length:192 start_codon:yes stop_codon:yes gene_type:complete
MSKLYHSTEEVGGLQRPQFSNHFNPVCFITLFEKCRLKKFNQNKQNVYSPIIYNIGETNENKE